MRDRKQTNKLKIIIVALLVVFIVGGFFGIKLVYDSGVKKGRETFKAETEEKLTALGAAVLEKSEFINFLNETLSSVPSEADEEDFEAYLENLETLISKTKNDSARSKLFEFKTSVSDFLDFYKDSNNNEEISERYSEIKIDSSKLSAELNEIYNKNIKTAAENLTR